MLQIQGLLWVAQQHRLRQGRVQPIQRRPFTVFIGNPQINLARVVFTILPLRGGVQRLRQRCGDWFVVFRGGRPRAALHIGGHGVEPVLPRKARGVYVIEALIIREKQLAVRQRRYISFLNHPLHTAGIGDEVQINLLAAHEQLLIHILHRQPGADGAMQPDFRVRGAEIKIRLHRIDPADDQRRLRLDLHVIQIAASA